MQCSVCGGRNFTRHSVLWQRLIDEWQISPYEAAYVDRQQGETCTSCGANLRSIALSNAIRCALGTDMMLNAYATSSQARDISILEINMAGSLTPTLKQFGRYVFGAYPEVDMHAIPYDAGTFDLIVHSDTLEHVPNPVHALAECRRVLKEGGTLCFTVPTIVDRMSRDRRGLPHSYHGDPETATDDLIVRTEFGADCWTYVVQAGFSNVTMHAVEYPCAIAIAAKH